MFKSNSVFNGIIRIVFFSLTIILVSGLAKLSVIGFGGNCDFCAFIKLVSDGPTGAGGGQSPVSGVGGCFLGKIG